MSAMEDELNVLLKKLQATEQVKKKIGNLATTEIG